MANLLASGIANVPHLAAFDEVVKARFDAIGLEALLVYLMDLVPSDALPWLAKQFDLLGIKGYGFTSTEQERRNLLKTAIELHRYKGTPWAIKSAVQKYGYTIIDIYERVGTTPRYGVGGLLYNDGIAYGSGDYHWTNFSVVFDPVQHPNVPAQDWQVITDIINEYKPARSHLYAITLRIPTIVDIVAVADSVDMAAQIAAFSSLGAAYNSTTTYGGGAIYGVGVQDVGPVPAVVTNWTPSDMTGLRFWAEPDNLTKAWLSNGTATLTNGSNTATFTGGNYVAGARVRFAGGVEYTVATVIPGTITLTVPYAGTSGTVAAEVVRVTAWTSQGGTGRVYTATASTFEPFDINGSMYMRKDDFLQLSPIFASDPANIVMVAIYEHDAANSDGILFAHRSSGNALIQFNANASTTQGQFRSSAGGSVATAQGTASTVAGYNIATWKFTQAGGSQTLETWLNGDQTTKASATSSHIGNFAATVELIGRYFNGTTTYNGFAGKLKALVLSDCNNTEILKTEGYLAHEFGLAANLPATHPYKNNRP